MKIQVLLNICLLVVLTDGQATTRNAIRGSIAQAVAEVRGVNSARIATQNAVPRTGAFNTPIGAAAGIVPIPLRPSSLTGVPPGTTLWKHGLFTSGPNLPRVLLMDENANVVMRAERNLVSLGGSPVELRTPTSMPNQIFRQEIAPFCSSSVSQPVCDLTAPFRTADGTCTNPQSPLQGASFQPQPRFLPPEYSANDLPRVFGVGNVPLPSARVISNIVHSAGTCSLRSEDNTVMFVTFGQFRDHDFTHTPVVLGPGNQIFDCCDASQASNRDCFPIAIPPGDLRFINRNCMSFTRSAAAVTNDCSPIGREQINQLTSCLDASAVYGSTLEEQIRLRGGANRQGGLLATSAGNFLPRGPDDTCLTNSSLEFCFEAGDVRVSEITTLTMFHLAFVRYHNNIARTLQFLNPFFNDERLFQETRKIVSAVLQHLTYEEYLPTVIGPALVAQFGLRPSPRGFRNVFNGAVDCSSRNEFGAAVFRFGHSQITDNLIFLNRNFLQVLRQPLQNEFDRPGLMFINNAVEFFARWMLSDLQSKEDRALQDSLRNFLFLDEMGDSLDLASFNIQRGRDHGVPPYNRFREFCGLRPAVHFNAGYGGLTNHAPLERLLLQKAYASTEDIDLFTGGLSETPVPGGVVGPTFACIMANQFRNFMVGDRFYYENNDPAVGFTEAQLNEIKKVRLASVVCDTLEQPAVQPRVMQRIRRNINPLIPCQYHPQIDLRLWRFSP